MDGTGTGAFGGVAPFFLLIAVVCIGLIFSAVLVAWPASRVCKRVGFSPWLGILAMLPLFNLVLLWYVALADWPSLSRPSDVR